MNSKVFISALVGAIFYFLFGWLVFGILLKDSMETGMTEGMKAVYRASTDYIYWAFGVANFATTLLLALIYNRFGVRSFKKGALNGLWIGLLVAGGYDFFMYAQTTMMDLNMVLMDVFIMAPIITALVGGVVGWMLGMGNKKTVTA